MQKTIHPAHVKYVPVNHPYGMPGCTNGRSGQTEAILLVTAGAAHSASQRRGDEAVAGARNLYEIVLWKPTGRPAAHLRPVGAVPAGSVGYMSGGNTVNVADLPEDVAAAVREFGVTGDTLKVHDRYESTAVYAALCE